MQRLLARRTAAVVAAGFLGVVLLAPLTMAQRSELTYTPVTDERLRNPEPENWLMYRGTYDSWGYSPLDQITIDNVATLTPVWSFSTGVTSGHQSPPMVNNGIMFITTPEDQVIALGSLVRPGVRGARRRYGSARRHHAVKITIAHRTSYRFDRPVFLEPHVVRLRPRSDASVRILDFELAVTPEPMVRAENLDLEGNVVTEASFEGLTPTLTLQTRATVETLLTNPFQFLVADPDRTLPYAYPPDRGGRLAVYRRPPDAVHSMVRELALDAALAAERDQAAFPIELARMIANDFTLGSREEGLPHAGGDRRIASGRLPRPDRAVRRVLPGDGTRRAFRQRLRPPGRAGAGAARAACLG